MDEFIKIYCDGGARGNPGPAAGAFVVEKKGRVVYQAATYFGKLTNNQAEYRAAIMGLTWLSKNPPALAENIVFVMDSELVTKQLSGFFRIKNEELRNLYFSAKNLEKKIPGRIIYRSVPRAKNKIADFLVNKVLDENP